MSDKNVFHVYLEGIEFSEDAKNRIQTGIQKVVMNELASYSPPDTNDDTKQK